MLGEKPVGALDQHAAELEGLRRKPQHAVPGLQHLSPHVVERVGEERQGAHVPDQILRGALGDDVDEPFALEARAEQLRRTAHHLAQFLLAERRHVDLQASLEQRLVALQGPVEVGAHAHHRAQARVGQRLRQRVRRNAAARALRRARKAPRPDRRRDRRPAAWADRAPCGGVRWRRSGRRASPCPARARSSHAAASRARDRSPSNCQASRKQSTSALIGSAPGFSVRKHHCRLF